MRRYRGTEPTISAETFHNTTKANKKLIRASNLCLWARQQ